MSDVQYENSPRDNLMLIGDPMFVAGCSCFRRYGGGKRQGSGSEDCHHIRYPSKNQTISRKTVVAMEVQLAESHRQAFGVSVSSAIILKNFPPKYSGLSLGNFLGLIINQLFDKYFYPEFKLKQKW